MPDSENLIFIQRRNLLALLPHVQLIHHLPGRLRVRVRPGVEAARALRRHADQGLDGLLQLLPGLNSARMNALTGSLVLEYDPKCMPFTLVDAFFRTTSTQQAGDLLDHLLSSASLIKKEIRHE